MALAACTTPSSLTDGEPSSRGTGARLSFGVTGAQAQEGHTSSFVLEATPDLAVHTALPDGTYEGKTLQIRGIDPQGAVVWSYPRVQKGKAFDVVLPVFGSTAARKHLTGAYTFELVAPDRTVVARGKATFTSTRDVAADGGGGQRGSGPAASLGKIAAGVER